MLLRGRGLGDSAARPNGGARYYRDGRMTTIAWIATNGGCKFAITLGEDREPMLHDAEKRKHNFSAISLAIGVGGVTMK
jgi:hypothetical protein